MKPSKQDIINYYKPNDVIQHPNDKTINCKFSDIKTICDNGTGGWNGFIKRTKKFPNGGIIILYSGLTNKYSDKL